MARKVVFNETDARRIAAATRAYERGNRDMPPIKFRSVSGDDGGGEDIRIGKISSDWPHGETATVERLDENGDPLDPASTFTAENFFNTVYVPSGEERYVACGLVGSTWILIEAERGCGESAHAKELDSEADEASSVAPLVEGDGTEVLVNEQGCAQWFKLASRTIVTDVAFVEGELVKTTEDVYVFAGTASPSTSTIIGTTECPPPE